MNYPEKLKIGDTIGICAPSDGISEPEKIEQDLIKFFPKEVLKDINHLFVWHGRNTCIARKPKCDTCVVNAYCQFYHSQTDQK